MSKSTASDVGRSVNAAARTLSILDAFLSREGPLSLSDLEAATGLFKSVLLRYMLSLEPNHYVSRRPDGKYQLGPKVYELGCRYERDFDLSAQVRPVLDHLTAETRESSSFYVREGDSRICLLRRDSPQYLRASMPQGTRLPLDRTASAQVLTTFTDRYPEAWTLKDCVLTTAKLNNPIPDASELTASMSAPVFRHGRVLAGALTVAGPVFRFDPTQTRLRRLLLDAARSLSTTLGAI